MQHGHRPRPRMPLLSRRNRLLRVGLRRVRALRTAQNCVKEHSNRQGRDGTDFGPAVHVLTYDPVPVIGSLPCLVVQILRVGVIDTPTLVDLGLIATLGAGVTIKAVEIRVQERKTFI
jgi:hypothetical protein